MSKLTLEFRPATIVMADKNLHDGKVESGQERWYHIKILMVLLVAFIGFGIVLFRRWSMLEGMDQDRMEMAIAFFFWFVVYGAYYFAKTFLPYYPVSDVMERIFGLDSVRPYLSNTTVKKRQQVKMTHQTSYTLQYPDIQIRLNHVILYHHHEFDGGNEKDPENIRVVITLKGETLDMGPVVRDMVKEGLPFIKASYSNPQQVSFDYEAEEIPKVLVDDLFMRRYEYEEGSFDDDE